MSGLNQLAMAAALLGAISVNAAHESNWVFPELWQAGRDKVLLAPGAQGRAPATAVERPQSELNNNELRGQ